MLFPLWHGEIPAQSGLPDGAAIVCTALVEWKRHQAALGRDTLAGTNGSAVSRRNENHGAGRQGMRVI